MNLMEIGASTRRSEFPVDTLFLGRWSPRAMSGEPLSKDELFSLFEAAKWAPSSSNEQPWRILYALRDTAEWKLFFDLLVEGNQVWAKNAAALLVFISRTTSTRNGAPLVTHSYDTGAAWQSLALQGISKNLVVHGMAGFDYERARRDLNVPDHFKVEAMAAVGKPAPKDTLPERLREREEPSTRRELKNTVAEGRWTDEIA